MDPAANPGGGTPATTPPSAPATPAAPTSVAPPSVPVVNTPPVTGAEQVAPVVGAATPEVAAPPAAPDLATQLSTLATSLGFGASDFEGFTSVESAKAAVTDYLNGLSDSQVSTQAAVPEVPAAPVVRRETQPVVEPSAKSVIDLKSLEIDENDPVAKVVRALEGKLDEANAAIKQIAEQREAEAKATKQAKADGMLRRAESTVDQFASTRYGVTGRRSVFQQKNLERLYRFADGLYLREKEQTGACSTPLETRLEIARQLDDPDYAAPAAAPASQVPAAPSAVGAVNTSIPTELSFYERWTDRPELKAALNIR